MNEKPKLVLRKFKIWIVPLVLGLELVFKQSGIGVYKVNSGVSFGLLDGRVSLIIWLSLLGVLLFWFVRKRSWAVWLMLCGGAANLADRLIWGGVIDWIKFPGGLWFNIADVCIVSGAFYWLITQFR